MHNLKATKEQIIDDLNGVMSDLQKKMMRTLLKHLDELNTHIRELDDDIDDFMKPDEKKATGSRAFPVSVIPAHRASSP